MKKFSFLFLAALTALIPFLAATSASAAINFNDPGFANTWNRVDKPVQEIPNLGRSWTWGPPVVGSENVTSEPYNGGTRKVQYFDKARMEVNNPNGNPNDLFYVTTGLLVKELVTGARQDGDNTFTGLQPSTIQVAGDPNDGTANAVAPTYASFKGVVTFFGNENGKDSAVGSVINTRIDKAGNVSTFTPPEQQTYGAYDSITRHNIANVFVTFGNQNGLIWNGTSFINGAVFFGNSVYVTGRPVTDAYWVRAVVAGTEKDVLVQLFERRVLTYTPGNPAGFQVEMGNVGQHYYKWRYLQNGGTTTPTTSPTTTTPAANPFPTDFSQAKASYNKSGAKPAGVTDTNVKGYPLGASAINNSAVVNSDQTIAVTGTANKGLVAINLTSNLNDTSTKWVYPTSGTIPALNGAPLLYNGVIYIGADDGKLYAINLADGTAKWPTPNNSSTGAPILGAPITDGTNIYFTSTNGRLYAVSLTDGTQVWQTNPVGAINSGPIFGFDGNLFFGSTDGKVYGFNKSGAALNTWTPPNLGSAIQASPAFANGVMYVGTQGGTLYALNSGGGTIKSNPVGGAIWNTPAVAGGIVYVGLDGGAGVGYVRGFLATDVGQLKFEFGTASPVRTSVAVVDGYLYFGAENGKFYQVEAANNANNVILFTAGAAYGTNAAIVANGRVYVSNQDGKFYIVK